MKKIKTVTTLLIITTMFVLLSGCSKKEEVTDVDIASLSNELLENVKFEDELNAVDDAMIEKLYGVDDYEDAKVYISTGATAEEIAVFKFQSTEIAEDGFKKAQERIENQKADFETYIPKEVKKLENAVVEQFGQYVVVCVSNGDGTEKIIEKYFNK